GEAATRRHIESGLKGGDVDPVTGRRILYYHDPMVPGKKFESPGKSPFMDMMLVPAYAGSEGADSGTVSVSSRIQQNLGLRTGTVVSGQWVSEVS
ncbi:efflux RND transporter periplasmic adaptor subunit, partial [Pseudomonas aeruginosa]|nr:efflux RND transporter periplasmic adaptor subunit [Pseudomonas aeruginosa]